MISDGKYLFWLGDKKVKISKSENYATSFRRLEGFLCGFLWGCV